MRALPVCECPHVAGQLAAARQPFLIAHGLSSPAIDGWATGFAGIYSCPLASSLECTVLLSPDGVVGHYDPDMWSVKVSEVVPSVGGGDLGLHWRPRECPGATAEGAPDPRHLCNHGVDLLGAMAFLESPPASDASEGASAAVVKAAAMALPACLVDDAARLVSLCQGPRPYVYLRASLPQLDVSQVLAGSRLEELAELLPKTFGLAQVSLYVSEAGLQTNLHCDERGGFLAQLRGRKRVVLFPPACRSLRSANWGTAATASPCSRRSWHSGGLPADWALQEPFAPLQGLEVEVGEGLALYTPRGWWHDVLSRDAETVGIIGRCVV